MNLQFLSFPGGTIPPGVSWLGGACLGSGDAAAGVPWPEQRLCAPLLGSQAPVLREGWQLNQPMRSGVTEGIRWQRSETLLFGLITLDEAEFADAALPLQTASRVAYERLFRLLAAQGLPHLWRVWNYLADINLDSHGLERYRQFNIGRQDAFLDHRRDTTGNVPAACAIGLAGGPLSIAFLAGTLNPIPLENPRQVSAYHYPAHYGPRAPTFSRGALVPASQQDLLFISGTASIVGHETVHQGDVVAQCRESLANIAAVVEQANRFVRGAPFRMRQLSYRAYLRRAEDFPAVQAAVLAQLGEAEVVYLQGDICRADLLVEIEAFGLQALGAR